MAVTQESAFNQITEEFTNQTSLAGLPKAQDTAVNFASELTEGKAGIVRTVANAVAFAIALISQMVDRAIAVLLDIAAKSEPSTDVWIAEKAREFRYKPDDPINPFPANIYEVFVPEDNIPTWSDEALADDTALIVKYSAAETIGGMCLVKINGDSGGFPVALPSIQRAACETYLRRLKPMGSQMTVVSRVPDQLTIAARIYFDPIQFEGLSARVEAAIQAFLKNQNFNGVISRNKLEDAIRNVPGVVQVVLVETKGRRAGLLPSSPQAVVFVRQFKTEAGSCLLDIPNSDLQYLSI